MECTRLAIGGEAHSAIMSCRFVVVGQEYLVVLKKKKKIQISNSNSKNEEKCKLGLGPSVDLLM